MQHLPFLWQQASQCKETLHSHQVPSRPWPKIGTDFFSWNDLNYLITKDYYSGFWEVDALPGTASRTVTNKLKAYFTRYGIPDVCISDNGPQFSSEEFKVFSHKMAIWAQDIFTRVSPKQRKGRASCQSSQDLNEEGKESWNRSIPFTLVAQKHSYPRARLKSCPTSNEQKDKNPTSRYCEPPYTNAFRYCRQEALCVLA